MQNFVVDTKLQMNGLNEVVRFRAAIEPRPDPVGGEEGYVTTDMFGATKLRVSLAEVITYTAKKAGIKRLPAPSGTAAPIVRGY